MTHEDSQEHVVLLKSINVSNNIQLHVCAVPFEQ